MKELPKVFQSKIEKNITNNDKYFYSNNEKRCVEQDKEEIKKIINDIFNSSNYVYKACVVIQTKDKTYETKLIGKNSKYLITMDNKTIPIDDILYIEKK